ncbi:MAG: M35 family metallo-endopeptidase [Pseudomonadota bacterium]
MTITFQGLSPTDRDTVTEIWNDMMATLAAPDQLDTNITRWFGANCPAAFRTGMPRVLRKFRTCMNLCNVTLMCCDLDDRDIDTFGAAYLNTNTGFAEIINFNPATQPDLKLELDSQWNIGISRYKTATDRDSAYQTIAHELSHLLMATNDHPWAFGSKCYGETKCRLLATNNDVRALTNADNWGYFIEDLRG